MEKRIRYVAHYVKSLDELRGCKNDIIVVHPNHDKFRWAEVTYDKQLKPTIEEHFIYLYPKEGCITYVEKLY